MYSSAAAQEEGSTLPSARWGAGRGRVYSCSMKGERERVQRGGRLPPPPKKVQGGAPWGAVGGWVCTPAGGSGSLTAWPGRSPRGLLGRLSLGPGLSSLGTGPFGGHWLGVQGGPARGPRGRGVETPRPAKGRRKGPTRSPREAGGRFTEAARRAGGRRPAGAAAGAARWRPGVRG